MSQKTGLHDAFDGTISLKWDLAEVGGGRIERTARALRLTDPPLHERRYCNAQITDYGFKHTRGRPAYDFRWRPPLTLRVRAWFEGALPPVGTAGFGFWNHPFSPDARRTPRLPAAIWFFYGALPNDMRLAHGVPGHGWKAAMIDAAHWRTLAIAPAAPALMLLMRMRGLFDRVYPQLQRVMRIAEAALPLDLLGQPHEYVIDWRADSADFRIDGAPVLRAPYAPRGPLGFCAWIDNQYAIVTPQGRFSFGIVPVPASQTLVLDDIAIEPVRPS